MEQIIEAVQQRIAEDPKVFSPTQLAAVVREEAGVISDVDVLAILRRLNHESTGVGLLEPIVATEGVTDVLVNGPNQVWFDRGQGLERSSLHFSSPAELRQLATRLALASGGRLDDAQPYVDGRLLRPDGSQLRIHAVLSPPAEQGTCLSLRVLRQAHLSLGALVQGGTMSAQIAQILHEIVLARRAFLVIGGTGSGKTTLLAALLAQVPEAERIICIEDTTELHPPHPHVINLSARHANVDNRGAITMSDLLRQALRMRPDRIVVGEIRGAEVVDLLAALNTGHEGGAGTVHANSLAEVPARMEALAALGGLDRAALHSQLGAAVDVLIHMRRGPGGKRQVHQIGLLHGNPVDVEVLWDSDLGEHPGFQRFQAELHPQGRCLV